MVEHDHFNQWINATKEWKSNDNLEHMEGMVEEMESLMPTATLDGW